MDLELRPLDLDDEAQFRRYHQIIWRAEKEDGRDWTTPYSFESMAKEYREPDPTERIEAWCAYDADRMVGAARMYFFLLDNTRKVWADVFVEPENRRRGIGSALVDKIVERARLDGRTQVTGDTTYAFDLRDDAPSLRFATRHGFRVANTEIRRVLRLPPAVGLLDEIEAESAPYHQDYRLECHVGCIPEALQESFCDLFNQLAVEAPGGEFDWEPDSLTPEIYRDQVRKMTEVGRQRFATVAVRDGEVAALSELVVRTGDPQASQWFTIVRRGERGHRLGAAVKVANLRALLRAVPDVKEIHTENAETNANMVAINDRLGFVPVAVVPGFLRDL